MLIRVLIPLVVLAVGLLVGYRLSQPVDEPAPKHVPPQVLETEVSELHRTDYTILLDSQGVIRAHHESTLTAGINGTILRIHPGFEDGAFFQAGELLVEINPADFEAAVAAARSQLARAEAALAQEEARARQARLNWEDLGYDEDPSELVLRVPQLKEARANVDAAQATLDQALRDLERTEVRAPFDGRVRGRLVGLGQSIGTSTPLGEVFSSDYAEVRLPLSASQLGFLDLPEDGSSSLPATITNALGSVAIDEPASWQARVVRSEGTLDPTSRELFVIARIDDPFGLQSDKPPLRIGQPVRAKIEGRVLEDVFVIPRQALRGLNRIYLVDQEEPAIVRTTIDPIWSTADVLIVREGLSDGSWLSTTRLPYAPDGAPVKIVEPAAAAGQPKPGSDS